MSALSPRTSRRDFAPQRFRVFVTACGALGAGRFGIIPIGALVVLVLLDPSSALAQTFDDQEIRRAICDLYRMSTGSFGALFALASGIGAIVAAAFGLYRAGVSFLVVAVSFFAIPAFVGLSFGDFDCSGFDAGGYDDTMIKAEICDRFQMIEGAWGALIMTAAGIVAIISAAIGAYRAGYTLLIVGIGAFVMRALISLFYGEFPCNQIYEQEKQKLEQFFQIGEEGGQDLEVP